MQTRAILAALLTLISTNAYADDIDVELISKAFSGQGKPALVVQVNKAIKSMTLELTRNDGKKITERTGRIRAGKIHRFELDVPVGTWQLKGSLTVTFANDTGGSMPLDLSVELAGPFTIDTSYERLSLEKGELQLQLTRTAGRCEYEVTVEGQPTRKGVSTFSGEPPGTWLTMRWEKFTDEDVVLRIRLLCWDPEGHFHSERLELFPWWLQIPHEEVNFDSGQWEILPSETPKLDRALTEITKAVNRYGKVVAVKLFVTGHTDTVGSNASNRTLSNNRARAISQYFRKRGVRVAISYAGFGEEDLAVLTPDETDEIRNRRAQYIIGVEAPMDAKWVKLR